jgi:hypothetical protein
MFDLASGSSLVGCLPHLYMDDLKLQDYSLLAAVIKASALLVPLDDVTYSESDSDYQSYIDNQRNSDDQDKAITFVDEVHDDFYNDWENSQVKYFDSQKKLLSGLFAHSPRELSDSEQHSIDLNKLASFLSDDQRIDYFISHHWITDNSLIMKKVTNFKEFINTKKNENVYPTFWFDKVCIDQSPENNISDSISLLPLYMSRCDKFLILLNRTYFTRLWCLWELFVLFAFESPEDALKRIEIVYVEEDVNIHNATANFSFEDAECFCPREKKTLLFIFENIVTVDRITSIVKDYLSKIPQDQTHKYIPPWW